MKTLMTIALALATTAAVGLAQDHPNFSGEWTLDLAKSDLGIIPPPATMTRKVDQKDPAVNVEEKQTGGQQGDTTSNMKYDASGAETTYTMFGGAATAKSTAKWEGKVLAVNTKTDIQGNELTITSKWSLSDDGKVWTDAWHIATSQGELDVTWVLNKK
jgi:hypothetical protein